LPRCARRFLRGFRLSKRTDKLSGSAGTARTGLAAMLDYARCGDTVVAAAAINRLGRSVAEVTRTLADLGERGITLRVTPLI